MSSEFDMTDLGKLSHYLGIEVKLESDYIELRQKAYAKRLLERAGTRDCNPVKYPTESRIQLDKDNNGKPVDSTMYKSIVGGLRFLVLVHTGLEISYVVGVVS